MNTKKVSIVVPVYNEEGNVAELHQEIKAVCEAEKYQYEIIFIDDGSTDKTAEIAKNLQPLKYIRFRKNFGQTAAMDAGIKRAENDYIITMDGDRQNDPNDIPNLISHLEKNDLDIVSGWRKNRKDTFMKRFVSRGANFLRKFLINDQIHDSGCSLKIYRKECFEHISLYGEMHRFIPAILKIKGFRVGEVVVNHRARTAGVTKYNWRRTIKGFIDMIAVWFWNKYAVRPLHLLGGMGLVFIILSIFAGIWVLITYFQNQDLSSTVLPLVAVSLFITGIQLFVAGLITDVLVKSYYQTTDDESYTIKEIISNE